MRLAVITFALLSMSFAQSTPTPQQPSSQPQQKPPAEEPQQPTQTAPRDPKAQPMAKSDAEANDYRAILSQQDLNAAQKAADDFALKYPDSELRVPVYSVLMQKSAAANSTDNVLGNALKVLAIDPDNTLALVISATTYAERTRDSDLDRDERYSRGIANAEKAIKTLETGLVVPPNTAPEAIAAAKRTITSMAHSAIGYIELNRKNYAAAEQRLQQAINANPAASDPATLYRLSLAQHAQKKYKEAMEAVNKAIAAAKTANDAITLRAAEEEKAKLTKVVGPAPQSPPPPQ